jgi:hypothetical protein
VIRVSLTLNAPDVCLLIQRINAPRRDWKRRTRFARGKKQIPSPQGEQNKKFCRIHSKELILYEFIQNYYFVEFVFFWLSGSSGFFSSRLVCGVGLVIPYVRFVGNVKDPPPRPRPPST